MKKDVIGIMDASNCIVLNAPMGAKVHQLGRLIASCSNVVWYNHDKNGNNPWNAYTADEKFTPFHFNRRFAGASESGFCKNSLYKIGVNNNKSLEEQAEYIGTWNNYIAPNYFVYPTHEPVEVCRQVFKYSKEVFIIPDVDACVDRFMQTSINYFVSASDKSYTFGDMFFNSKENVRKHIQSKCNNLEQSLNSNVYVVEDVNTLKDKDTFKKMCKFLELDFNDNYYNVVEFINAYS